jgi:hypothetical protein
MQELVRRQRGAQCVSSLVELPQFFICKLTSRNKASRIRVIKQGKRTFVPGGEIARLSTLDIKTTPEVGPETKPPAKPEIKGRTAYRLLDSRIHQALMKDLACQQALWDSIEKIDRRNAPALNLHRLRNF